MFLAASALAAGAPPPAHPTGAPAGGHVGPVNAKPPPAGAPKGNAGGAGKAEVTWWGHAAFIVKSPGGAIIAIDPWLQNPRAPQGAPQPDALDAILVTHAHSDHVGNTLDLATKTQATVVGSYELIAQLGVAKGNGLNAGGSMRIKDVTITAVPAVHSSGYVANPADQTAKPVYGGAPLGYIIAIDHGTTLYHAGDTDYFAGMSYIAERFKPTVAMLPIGGQYTMDPMGAAYAAKALKVKTVVPMHFGTFPALSGTPADLTAAIKTVHATSKVEELQPGVATWL
ncbi:MAG: metal-dependent hydrolase [Deltaproteobacteria bacterium]|nr:metal-dependent hydrolase [Deltaproteobacteria bacterium]